MDEPLASLGGPRKAEISARLKTALALPIGAVLTARVVAHDPERSLTTLQVAIEILLKGRIGASFKGADP